MKKYKRSVRRKPENFKTLAKQVSYILKRDYKISLNFEGYDAIMNDIKRIDEVDLNTIYILIKNCSEWSSYLNEVKNILNMYEDLYKCKYEILEYMKTLNEFDKEHLLTGKDRLLTDSFRRRFKILSISDSDLEEELKTKKAVAKEEHKIIKKFINVIEAKSRYFEAVFYSLSSTYNKSMYNLHFKFY